MKQKQLGKIPPQVARHQKCPATTLCNINRRAAKHGPLLPSASITEQPRKNYYKPFMAHKNAMDKVGYWLKGRTRQLGRKEKTKKRKKTVLLESRKVSQRRHFFQTGKKHAKFSANHVTNEHSQTKGVWVRAWEANKIEGRHLFLPRLNGREKVKAKMKGLYCGV